MLKSLLKKIGVLVLLLVFVFPVPFDAEAMGSFSSYDAGHFSVTINPSSRMYVGTPIMFTGREKSHPEYKYLYATANYQPAKSMPLTFPSSQGDMTRVDHLGLRILQNTLLPSMNAALYEISGGQGFGSSEEFRAASDALVNATRFQAGEVSYNGFRIIPNSKTGRTYLEFAFDTNGDGQINNLPDDHYLTIVKPNGSRTSYVYKIPKITSGEDAGLNISWEMLINQARIYESLGFFADNISQSINPPGPVAKAVASGMNFIFSGVEQLLGLLSFTDLVFNEGLRNDAFYVYGVFPRSWLPLISSLFLVFQAIAWATLLFSIINLVFRKNLSTISSSMRVEVMMSIQQYIIAGFLLAFLFPALNIFFRMNFLLVDVFSNLINPTQKATFTASLPSHGGSIATIIAYIAYFIALLDINIAYIVRSILVALLICIAPLMIVMGTVSDAKKGVVKEWGMNLTANVFIQSIHALVLAFLMAVPISGLRGIEPLVYVFSIIPISEAIRRILFNNAGKEIDGISDEARGFMWRGFIAKAMLSAFNGPMKWLKKGAGVAVGAAASKVFGDGGGSDDGGGGSSGSSGGNNGGSGGAIASKGDKIKSRINENEKNASNTYNSSTQDSNYVNPNYKGKNYDPNYKESKKDPNYVNPNYKGKNYDPNYQENKKKQQAANQMNSTTKNPPYKDINAGKSKEILEKSAKRAAEIKALDIQEIHKFNEKNYGVHSAFDREEEMYLKELEEGIFDDPPQLGTFDIQEYNRNIEKYGKKMKTLDEIMRLDEMM